MPVGAAGEADYRGGSDANLESMQRLGGWQALCQGSNSNATDRCCGPVRRSMWSALGAAAVNGMQSVAITPSRVRLC